MVGVTPSGKTAPSRSQETPDTSARSHRAGDRRSRALGLAAAGERVSDAIACERSLGSTQLQTAAPESKSIRLQIRVSKNQLPAWRCARTFPSILMLLIQ